MKKAHSIRLTIAAIIGLLIIAGFFGFYPVKILDLQVVPLIGRIVSNASITAFFLIIAIFLITLIFGRFYCSLLCPFGLLEEFFSIFFRKKNKKTKNLPFKYFILALTFGYLLGGSCLLIRYIDPYSIFGSFITMSAFGIIFTFFILVLVFYKNRYFCSNICPVGALLGLISKFSIKKINIDKNLCVNCSICEKSCPTGSIDHKEGLVDNKTCIRCLSCISKCPKGAIGFKSLKKEEKFNPKRREFLTLTGALVLFDSFYALSKNLALKTAKKVKDIILPAGAGNIERFQNKCLNCNLCVNNCPEKIIAKANDNCPTIHIDYSRGSKYCKFDCKKCQEVCPSGAIQKTTLNQKQNTRIAMAVINENCVNCGICANNCPKGAIIKTNDKYTINALSCIGCNKCAALCPNSAIQIFSINEQKTI